jgi:predicted small lipoprotein YifL
MKQLFITYVGVAALAVLAGCNNAKSPDSAAHDIAAANQSAADKVADAQRDTQKDMSADAYNVAIAQADGDHKVAIQKCETLQGHDQQACKDQAEADYEAAKANAKAAKVSSQP